MWGLTSAERAEKSERKPLAGSREAQERRDEVQRKSAAKAAWKACVARR